jgi:hypothetical protein
MKTLFPQILIGLLLVVLTSCKDEGDPAASGQRAVIQFQQEQQTLREDDNDGVVVSLALNRALASAGTVTLKIAEDMQQRIQTVPAHAAGVLSLPIAKGASQVQFSVKAIDNIHAEGDQTVMLSLESAAGLILGEQNALQLIIEDDDNGTNNPEPVQSMANFAEHSEAISENAGEALAYKIIFTPAVAVESKVVIAISTAHADAFVTQPAVENNTITLVAPAGTSELTFSVEAINNTVINGNTEIEFSIASTEGSVIKGTNLIQDLTISDDELAGKIKGYEVTSAESGEKRTFEYDSKGRIARVIIAKLAPFNNTTITETYFYDDQDRLVKINKWLGRDILYTWNNNRIERADVYQDGVLIQYATYAYDDQGNVGGVEPFYKQANGTFSRGLFSIYLYFTNGNLYKALTYNDVAGSEEPALISTRTYDDYLDVTAPVAMLDILPNVSAQKNLAGSYRLEEHMVDRDTQYKLTYEFRPDGQPSKRTAAAPGDTQVALYHYY